MDPKLRGSLDAAQQRADAARTSGNEARQRGIKMSGYATRAEAKRLARPL